MPINIQIIVKTIHNSPQLDLVGWYTVLPQTGPTLGILPIHESILLKQNEYALLLAFHPEEAVQHSAGSKLPLTIYESNYEATDEPRVDQDDDEDKEMRDGDPPLRLKFRELPYSVETGEAEMISMDFVARGAGNATMVEPKEQKKQITKSATETDPKGKKVASAPETQDSSHVAVVNILSREDEEMIAAITAKANAVKMLQSRVNLLTTYLERLPPSYLSPNNTTNLSDGQYTIPSHPILRSIQALVSRLPLLVPSDKEAYELEMLRETNDVHLMELLNDVMQSLNETRDIGKKYTIVETAKSHSKKITDNPRGGIPGGYDYAGPGDLAV